VEEKKRPLQKVGCAWVEQQDTQWGAVMGGCFFLQSPSEKMEAWNGRQRSKDWLLKCIGPIASHKS
jgi:hypothetical protein